MDGVVDGVVDGLDVKQRSFRGGRDDCGRSFFSGRHNSYRKKLGIENGGAMFKFNELRYDFLTDCSLRQISKFYGDTPVQSLRSASFIPIPPLKIS